MKEKISVIVPVYNAEAYLEECLSSILEQTYENLQIILVDDGSTDNSGSICDKYENKDERVFCIHKTNGGNTSARKAGIANASGNYLLFVDSDDWIDKDTCEFCMTQVEEYQADVVGFAYKEENSYGKTVYNGIPTGIYVSEADKKYLYSNFFFCKERNSGGITRSLCVFLISRDIMTSIYDLMEDTAQYGEDAAYAASAILSAKVVCLTNRVLYHYRMRKGSIIHKTNLDYYSQINATYKYLYSFFMKHPFKDALIEQLNRYMDELVIAGLNRCFNNSRSHRVPAYVCNLDSIEKESKVIIYGAGDVGASYYKYLVTDGKYHVANWVDKEWKKYQSIGLPVNSPEVLLENKFDYVIIAVLYENVVQKIQDELIERYNIKMEKIYWEKPIHILDYYDDERIANIQSAREKDAL